MNVQARGTSSASAILSRIEDRDPADPKAASARGEPEPIEPADCRIAARFGHGQHAEAVALLGRFVAEHRQVDRRVAHTRKLKLRIELSALATVCAERMPVGRLEIGADRGAARLRRRRARSGWAGNCQPRARAWRGRRARPTSPRPALRRRENGVRPAAKPGVRRTWPERPRRTAALRVPHTPVPPSPLP